MWFSFSKPSAVMMALAKQPGRLPDTRADGAQP
jgi:hypothetical protein